MINFDRLVADANLPGLEAALRYRPDPDLRMAAARALGGLDNLDAVEPLIRSHLEDPDPDVRAASLASLKELVGLETSLAIQTYRSGPPDPEPWLVEGGLDNLPVYLDGDDDDESDPDSEGLEGEEPPGDDNEVQSLSDNEVHGLIGILAGESNVHLRLKAIRAIARSRDARAVAILAQSAYYSDEEVVRQAARRALESMYGDDAERVLASLLPEGPDEDTEEEDSEENEADEFAEADYDDNLEEATDDEPGEADPPERQRGGLPVIPFSEVMREEGTPWLWLLAAAAAILIIVVILIVLLV